MKQKTIFKNFGKIGYRYCLQSINGQYIGINLKKIHIKIHKIHIGQSLVVLSIFETQQQNHCFLAKTFEPEMLKAQLKVSTL